MAEDLNWYVAKTKAKQERAISLKLKALGIESYVPIRTELRSWHDRKKKVDVVLIPNTIFIRTAKSIAFDIHNVHGIQVSYLRNHADKNSIMVIPDYQMDDFRRFLELSKGNFDIDEDAKYVKGDSVIVIKGPLKGVVGELVRVESKNKVVVRLGDFLACSVKLNLEDLEKIGDLT